MRFFDVEDNKKLYESDLPDTLKNYIANVNEVIIFFLKEKFKDQEKLNEFLNNIKENYKKTNFKLIKDEYSSSNAAYNTFTKTFEINEKTLEQINLEQGLLAIYFHEFSHFISSINNKKITKRKEEGIADLFSDELVDYFNKTFKQQTTIEKKSSEYKKSSSIIRNACLLNNNTQDLIWNYYQNNEEKVKDFFKKAYGNDATNLIFNIETYSNNPYYISKKEEEYISKALENKDIENIEEIYIRLNTILQKRLCEKLIEKKYTLEQIKQEYKQIPKEFYENYKIMFSNINQEKQEIINSEELSNEKLETLAENFLNYININQYINPNQTTNEIEIELPMNLSKYIDIFKINMVPLIPALHAYKLKYNNKNFSEKEMLNLTKRLGFNQQMSEKIIERMTQLAQIAFNQFKNLTEEECFEIIKKILKQQIKDLTKKEFYLNKLNNKKINIEEYINIISEEYKNSESQLYDPSLYIISIIEEYTKRQTEELNIDTFEQTKQEIQKVLSKINPQYTPSIVGYIINSWNIEKKSIYNILEILTKNKIETNISSEAFEDIRIKGIIELSKEKNINNIIKYINNIINSENDNIPFFYKKNGNIISKTDSTKTTQKIIFEKLEEAVKNNNEILKEKIKNNDKALIKFYEYRNQTPLKEDEKIIIQKLTGIKKDSNIITDYIETKFNNELYEKLKQYPTLALTYIGYFQPNAQVTIYDTYRILKNYNTIKHPYLKEENKNLFIELVKEINKGYEIKQYELRNIDITYELKLISNFPYEILDEETQKKFIIELLNICNKKTEQLFINNIEQIEQLKYNLKTTIDNIKYEYIKNELEKIYNKIKTYEIKITNENTNTK